MKTVSKTGLKNFQPTDVSIVAKELTILVHYLPLMQPTSITVIALIKTLTLR